jgi:hypothetical protein
MTEKILEQAQENRWMRKNVLIEYNKISKIIDLFDNEGLRFSARVRPCEQESWEHIFPKAEDFRDLLIKMQDRFAASIAELDKEFEEL